MCEKTDGIRCLLYMTQGPDDAGIIGETQFLIDRKNDYYHIPNGWLHFPPFEWKKNGTLAEHNTNTILDGELVLQTLKDGTKRKCYLIFDMLCFDGKSVMDRKLDVRLGKLHMFIYQPYLEFAKENPQEVAVQPFHVEMKKMEFPYGTEMMFKEKIPNLPHGNDGLIFTCRTTPYVSGTDSHILKWKPPHENTIDFKLQLGEFPTLEDKDGVYEDFDAIPSFELLVNHGNGREEVFAMLSLTEAEWEAMKGMQQFLDHRIIECYKDKRTQRWRPKIEADGTPRFRDDKRDANHVSTVSSVLDSIEDAVTEEDLIAHASKIREAWKERERMKKAAEAEEAKRRQAARAQQQQMVTKQSAPVEEDDDGPKYED